MRRVAVLQGDVLWVSESGSRVENTAPQRAHAPRGRRALSCCRVPQGRAQARGNFGRSDVDYLVSYSELQRSPPVKEVPHKHLASGFVSLFVCIYCLLLPDRQTVAAPEPIGKVRLPIHQRQESRIDRASWSRAALKHALDRSAGVRCSISMRPLTKLIDRSSRLFEDDSHSVVEIRTDSLSTLRELGPPDLVHLVKQPVKSTNKQVIEHPWAKETLSGIQTATRSVC